MGSIRNIDDITYDEDMCLSYATHIVHSNEFKDEIVKAARKDESETSFFIDKILYDVLEKYDSRPKPHYPSDSEWQLIIDHMKILLASEGIEITKHGWNDDDDWDEYIGNDDKRDYAIYLDWRTGSYKEDMCLDYAAHIVHSNEFEDEIAKAVDKNESETSFFIDKILYDVLEKYDSRLKIHYPSDSEWQLIIDHMEILLASKDVEITKHGWNDDDDWDEYIGDDDKRDYAIYLGW